MFGYFRCLGWCRDQLRRSFIIWVCHALPVVRYTRNRSSRAGEPPDVVHCPVDSFLDPKIWDNDIRQDLASWLEVAGRACGDNVRLVLSETASAADGGCRGLSNTFAAGFYWIDLLGIAARQKLWDVYRQDLVGVGSYGLLGDPDWVGGDLSPNPDYFSTILWKRVMGQTVLDVQIRPDPSTNRTRMTTQKNPGVRLHAACAQTGPVGAVSIAFINPESEVATLCVRFSVAGSVLPRDEYRLTAGPASHGRVSDPHNLTSRKIRLNGARRPLDLGATLPPLRVTKATKLSRRSCANGGEIVLGERSYGFVVLLNASAPACQ